MKRRGFLKALVAAVAAPAAVKAAVESPEAFRAEYECEYISEFGAQKIVDARLERYELDDASELTDLVNHIDPAETPFMKAMKRRDEARKLIAEWTIADAKKPWGSP